MQSIVRKAVRPFMVVLKGIILSLIICATGGAWAAVTKTNPVTGETETYENTFTGGTNGTGTEWNDTANWDTAVTPFVSGDYNASLVSNKTASTSTSTAVDGWTLRVGAYDGAVVTWSGGISKIQAGTAGCWLTADATSSITLAFNGNSKQLEGSSTYPLKLSSAKAGGITWTSGLSNAGNTTLPFWYYLKGAGTVVYGGDITVANAQVVKQADVTLTGTSQVSSKTLVTFGSGTTATFTADAEIKVYDIDGETLVDTVYLATVNNTGETTLTEESAVGTCELVQTSTGIDLYYVDGDPSSIVAKTYKPSININFAYGNNPLTTAADVGISDYSVPGTSWNNMVSPSEAFTTPLTTIYKVDSTGATSLISGASVAVSGTRGSYRYNDDSGATTLYHGYIDDRNNATDTPTIVVTGIPYYAYKLVVYFSNDIDARNFGYITVNGSHYKGDSENNTTVTCDGESTDKWGAASHSGWTEGGNYLVIPDQVNADGNLTIVSHCLSGARAGVAAVQIVEVPKTAEEGELVINVSGDTTYTVSEDATYTTVYVTGAGTLAFSDEGTITTTTLNVGPGATVPMGSSLTPTTVTGAGTVVYNGAVPTTGLGWTDSANWKGTLWVKNTTFTGVVPNTMANANSTLRLSGVVGYFNNGGSKQTCDGTLELENDSYSYAFSVSDGYSTYGITVFAKLKGSGLLGVQSANIAQRYVFKDASEFTGTFNLAARTLRVILGDGESLSPDEGTITIVSGATATVASGKTWTANTGGFRVEGTLNVNGTLASSASAAIKGSGTVVSTGKLPSVNGSAWWQNTDWTGTLWIKSYAISALNSNLYGNEGSTLKFTGVTGYFAQSHVNTVPIELENSGSTVAFNYNDGWGGELLTFSELKGTGTLQTSNAGDGGTIWVKKWDAFTGVMNLGKKQVVMGGSEPAHGNVNRGGKLVIAEGAVVTNLNSTTSWTAGGGIEVNGTFAASDRTAWADGTAMTINSTGILNMYGSGVNDTSKSFANVTGTGTIWYSQTTTANDKWSALPSSAANMFANTLSVSNDNVNAGVIITMNGASDVVTTNANVSGTGYFRSDWNSGTYRGFLALQSKNTTWSGTFGSSSRIKKFIVAGVDGATDRTLTLAGTQSSTIPLTVESLGSVNITGTYLGATTVAGTFGGTGTLTGNLTFEAGATFKAFASDTDGLAVSGTVAYPEEGTVTVDVSDLTLSSSGTTLITFTSAPSAEDIASKMAPSSGAFLKLDGSTLKAYPLVATYNDENYATIAEAINAAEQAGDTYADVTILDPNATCPDGYYIDAENNNALAMYQAAYVLTDSTKAYFKTAQLAVNSIQTAENATAYKFSRFEVYYGTEAAMSIDLSAAIWGTLNRTIKVKCLNGATVVVTITSDEYALSASAADEDGIVTYSKTAKAATYFWAAASQASWSRPTNWKVGSAEGATAARAPSETDTAILGNGANVSGVDTVLSVAALQVSGAVTISGGGSLTSESAITLGASDSITITGTLSPTPTTNVSHSRVKTVTVDGTTTYSVEVIPGTIFSVY